MKKIFRMKYEPCSGSCYAWDNVYSLKALAEDKERFDFVLRQILQAHGPACGNQYISYGIDFDEASQYFIGSFIHFGKLELVIEKDSVRVLELLLSIVNAFWDSPKGKEELQINPGLGHSVCEHGEEEELTQFMLAASGMRL